MKFVTPETAVSYIQSEDRVFIQGAAMTPTTLVRALSERYRELRDVELISIHTEGEAPYTDPEKSKAFRINSCFVGGNVRRAVNSSQGDYIPVFLSEIHYLFRRKVLPLQAALIQVSPPDKHGYCSLGVSVDVTLPALESAELVIAQINPQVPRTHGDGIIHESDIDYAIQTDQPIQIHDPEEISDTEARIGENVAALIEDGSTLQMGIGSIPNAVLQNLQHHKRLGVHTEMFSDGLLSLIEKGVITGEEKQVKKGKVVTCFAVGSQKLYDYVDDNPSVHFKETAYTNDTAIIRRNPKVVAINSAIEIDLTGQICADTIGPYQYSGVGGQMDFIRGASLSEGGKPVFAFSSVTGKGVSKITPYLNQGAGVTTTRAHVNYVATEYGVVNLFGKNLRQRADALISIAHPDHREGLEKAAFERFRSSLNK